MEAIIDTLTGNGLPDYLLGAAILLAGAMAARSVKYAFDRKVKNYITSADFKLRGFVIDVVEKGVLPFLYLAVLYAALNSLYLNPRIDRLVDMAGIVVLSLFAARIGADVIETLLTTLGKRGEEEGEELVIPGGVIKLLRLMIWTVAILFLLDNLGFNVTALVAGLGVGGVALALASQAILGDLFNYFVILFDKPFRKGDFIIVGDKMGAIERIGLKTTRIRSLGGEELVFSNTDLTNSRIHNYKKMENRRVVFKLGVTYQATSEQLERAPAVIRRIIEGIEDTTFDRAHFASYGDFALIFEIVYYVTGSDYIKYMDIQQRINLSIKNEFEKLGLEFAYPTQTVFIEKTREA